MMRTVCGLQSLSLVRPSCSPLQSKATSFRGSGEFRGLGVRSNVGASPSRRRPRLSTSGERPEVRSLNRSDCNLHLHSRDTVTSDV